ncbi:MAG: hypothetical protein HIU93_08430 [Acidobacteria bacterium]|nr:hypothetical protein [Acidobacteriota bacterium]MBW4045597.1 hypothetical protein [Acidobacteriota bacterium]
MLTARNYLAFALLTATAFGAATSAPTPVETSSFLENPFQTGAMLQDTNGDKVADAICGHIIVSPAASEAENAAAANLAARLGYGTSALTLPVVVSEPAPAPQTECKTSNNIWIGSSLPSGERAKLAPLLEDLSLSEGGIYAVPGGITVQAHDEVGLLAAANALAARAPYLWSLPGVKINSLAAALNAAFEKAGLQAHADLRGLTYLSRTPGVRLAVFSVSGSTDLAGIDKALKPEEPGTPLQLHGIREARLLIGETPLTIAGVPQPLSEGLPSTPEASAEAARSLDLGELYTIKGLLNGSPKKPIPSAVATHLYITAGARGTAMANLAARIGLETTGIILPLAEPASGVSPAQVKTSAVVGGDSALSQRLTDILSAPGNVDLDKLVRGQYLHTPKSPEFDALAASEGELRVVDRGFGKQDALLVRGDDQGAAAAISYAADHLPFLWEPSKRYASVEEMRDDVRHFFTLRSGVGQATVSLYHLDRWLDELSKSEQGKHLYSVTAEVYVDEADPRLSDFLRKEISSRIHADHVEVKTGSLHAGLKCCASDPPLHRTSNVVPFMQAKPTIAEDIVIPWEGRRLLEAVQKASVGLPVQGDVKVEARVSESPEERAKLSQQIAAILQKNGATPDRIHVEVLSAYKQGYSWLLDGVAQELAGKAVDHITIEFAPYGDPAKLSSMRSISRWVQELYPADEMLAKKLGISLTKISFSKMADASGPTYRVHAYAADGHELLQQPFAVKIAERSYSSEFANYDHVNVETGWLHMTAGGEVKADERIETDSEYFWDHYQTETLPAIYKYILKQNNGKPKVEYQPLFDTLRVSFHMSEPDYNIGLDQERISSLEALQEDTLFSTQNFFYMLGNLESTGMMDYLGRVIPVAYPSTEGQDGHVRIEFYAKDAAHPMVRLAWKEHADSPEQEKKRDLPVLKAGGIRLVAARVLAGRDGVESLTWRVPVDAREDKFDEWEKLVPEEQLEHTAMFAEQGEGQLAWLGKLHTAGLYKDELAYPHLAHLAFEFQLPLGFHPPELTKHEVVASTLEVAPPVHPRPQITDITPAPLNAQQRFVQWERPIGPAESAHLLARLATYPGVNVYWMGRTYLGNNIWAADVLLPTPSAHRSMAKETTYKAAIIYSGRQHANEVSSTSHLFRLAEQLVTDPATRASLDKVNVVIHPITNIDGAQLAMDLAKITPNNMLHPGYHASLTADLVTDQWKSDPLYPESRTRRQLWQTWLPDAFLNPHGYPSHEWVQPFSEYAAWVITRTEAESGRAWWIPRGWFTSLNYLKDPEHPESETVTLALRDYIANNMVKTPGVLDMNAKMNARYFRYGQQWDKRDFQQPIYKGVRIYMAQVGTTPDPQSQSFLGRFPDVTYDDGYTEAPDETAYGDWLKLVASAGLAYDHAHLQYLSDAKMKIKHTQKEFFDGVSWKVDRQRPMLPANIDTLDHQK